MAKGPYRRHRENQREVLLNAAEDLFIKKGIELVTVNDIVKAANITRPTLYKYFSGKEEMAIEIFKVVTTGWADDDREKVWKLEGTGYECVERFVMHHFERLLDNARETSFIAEFNYLYAKQWSSEQALEIIRETLGEGESKLREAVTAGQSDGSIRTDMDVDLIIASVFNFNSGMMNRLGELGPKLDFEFDMPGRKIFIQIARLFLDGIAR